jgi:predicted dienelactone hydrolase
MRSLAVFSICALALGATPAKGPYTAVSSTFSSATLDSSDRHIAVFAPKADAASAGKTFPLISFAHGLNSGNPATDYKKLFEAVVSFGYVIAAPMACNSGCKDDTASLRGDPKGFAHFYKQQLLTIEWAKAQATEPKNPTFYKRLDLSHGVGIAGHSMGGQATVFSSSYGNATSHNISAAVMLHAFTHEYVDHPPPRPAPPPALCFHL